jgi:hypothetical protein
MRVALLSVLLLACGGAAEKPAPPITDKLVDDFERTELGSDWRITDPENYLLTGGQLHVKGAYNHPAWLRRPMPADATIELDVKSLSPEGDIKLEAWGDGKRHAASKKKVQYTASGYVFIFGGWNNSKSIIAKRSEHGADVVERTDTKVEPGKTYHFKIVRKGGRIDWFIDDMSKPFLTLEDKEPLVGPRHAHFAFSNWESDLWFDNLSITPN